MTFYVNVLNDNKLRDKLGVTWPNDIIALFDDYTWSGEGNCCGWYGAEYFLDTKVYAYYIAEGNTYTPKNRISEVTVCNSPIKYEKVMIGSCYWTRVINAKSVDEAIKKFQNGEWENR